MRIHSGQSFKVLAAAAVFIAGGAQAQSVKLGIVAPFSGPFAHCGALFKAGAEAYVAGQRLAHDTGVAVLLFEQKVDDALRFARAAVLLARGEVVHRAPCEALRAQPELLERHVGVAH